MSYRYPALQRRRSFHERLGHSLPLLLGIILASFFPARTHAQSDAGQPEWRAASARVKITPAEAMWMAGYAARTEPSQGVEQDLYAKALAVEDATGTRLVIITTDLIGIPRSLRDSLVARVGKEFDRGGAMRYTFLPGPFDPGVEQQIVRAVKELARETSP